MATSRSALPEGHVLADYEILDVIGAGGFGITYRARDLALKRLFAIKEYSPFELSGREGTTIYPYEDSADDYEKGLEDFLREAETLARFDHPNIVRVARFFRANGTAYMVLNFEQGSTLKEWLREHEGPVSQSEIDNILSPLLDALALIHVDGVLHRDIAPDNIYIRKNGTPVLLDFGSARQSLSRSHSMSAIVKPGFSPQEQYSNRASNQGPWTDIYALAATAYRAVTGSAPPEASERVVLDDYIPLTRQRPPGYRQTFLAAVDWAMEVKHHDRPQTIDAWRGPLLKNQPVPPRSKKVDAERAPQRDTYRRAATSFPIWPVALAAVVFGLLAGGSTWLYFNGQLFAARAETVAMTNELGTLRAEAAAARQALEKAEADAAVRGRALEQQIADSEKRAQDLEAQLAAGNSSTSSSQLNALQAALDEERGRTAQLTKAASDNQAALREATARYQAAEARATEAEAVAAEEAETHRKALADALGKLSESQAAQATARQDIEATQKALSTAQTEFQAQLATLQAQKDASENRIATLTTQIEDAKRNAAASAGNDNAAQERIAQLQTQLDTERKQADDQAAENGEAIARLNATVGDLTEKLTAQNAAVKTAVSTLQTVRADAAAQIAAAENRETEAHEAAVEAQRNFRAAETKAATAARAAETRLAEVQAAGATLEEELAVARKQVTDGNAEAARAVSKLEIELATQKKEAAAAAEATAAAKARSDEQIALLSGQVEAGDAALRQARADAAEAQEKSQELAELMSSRVAELQGELRNSRAAEAAAQEALTAAKAAAEQASDQQITELQASVAALERQVSSEQANVRELTAERDQLKREAEMRIAELEQQIGRLEASSDENAAAAQEALKNEIDALRNLGAQPSVAVAGLEIAPSTEDASFLVRTVDPTSPFAALLQSGMVVDSFSLAGSRVDLGDGVAASRLAPEACDAIAATIRTADGPQDLNGFVPASFGASAVANPLALPGTGLEVATFEADRMPVINAVEANSVGGMSGLAVGDRVYHFGNDAPATAEELSALVAAAVERGGSVPVTIERDCVRRDIAMDFGAPAQSFDWAGLTLRSTEGAAPRIAALAAGSQFDGSGLLEGDQIDAIEVAGESVELPGLNGARATLDALAMCGEVRIRYTRGGLGGTVAISFTPDLNGASAIGFDDFGFSGQALASGGILVGELMPNSPFAAAGLVPGEVVTAIGTTSGPALATIGAQARERFMQQGGQATVINGCETRTLHVAAYDPTSDAVDLAGMRAAERRMLIRALYKLGHYQSGDMPAAFATSGTVDQAIAEAFAAYRATQGEAADAALSLADAQRLFPEGQDKLPGEIEQEVLLAVLPDRVLANPDLVNLRMRLFASTQGYDDPQGRLALRAWQQANGSAIPGYVTSEAEAHTIFTEPLNLRTAPAARRSFGDWRVQEINEECAIYVLPSRITGAFYRYTNNASFSDRPAIWLKTSKAGGSQVSTQMSGDFGGNFSELDLQSPVVMVTADGQSLPTRRSRDSLVPPSQNGAPSNSLQKALLTSSWVEIRGTSKYGGDLTIRYETAGFRDAFDYLNNTCARGGLSPYLL